MSAPPGHDIGASMLPAIGGTIHAMRGGSMTSPYTGGVTAATSMLDAPPPSAVHIAGYKGGSLNNVGVAVAVAASANANAAASAQASEASAQPSADPVEKSEASVQQSEASVQQSEASAQPSVQQSEASAAASAQPSAQSSAASAQPPAASIENPDPSSELPVIASDLIPSDKTNPFAIAAVAAVSASISSKDETDELNETDETDETDESKSITVYGKKYNITNPEKYKTNNEGWNKLLSMLHFDIFDEDKQQKIKQMIYDQPTCLEEDLPISSAVKCAPMREIIQMIAIELLRKGYMNDSSGRTVHIEFDPEKQVKSLSETKFQMMINPSELSASSDPEAPSQSEAPSQPEAPSEPISKGGKVRDRKRRIIRKHK